MIALKNNKRLVVIAAVTLVGALGYGIVIPILYPYSVEYGLTDFQNGILFAIFSIFQFISTPIIGILSDKYGRRPLLIFSLLGTAGSFFLMAFAPSAIFLFIARALDGATAGNIPVAQAVISDSIEGKDRTHAFGIIGACFGIGFIAGPAISALTVGISIKLPFIIAGVISLIAVILAVILLDETNQHIGITKPGKTRKIFDFKKLGQEILSPNTGLMLVISLLWAFAFGMFIYAFQPFSLKMLHLNERTVSLIFVLFGLVGLVSQVFFVSRISKILGVRKAFTLALSTLGVSFILFFFTKNIYSLILATIVMSLANSTVQTLTQTMLSNTTSPERQGEIMGINSSYMSIGQILGPIAGGSLALLAINYPFLAGGLVIFTAVIISKKIIFKSVY
ncbi:MAG TPA: MFS transporter [Candidatus Paceibacterota bacterium]|jgi:MFS family permease|nr:MFS transporter [Candidatus Paceibacterota bacterium]